MKLFTGVCMNIGYRSLQPTSGPNPVPADRLSTQDRRRELCFILAAGLVRLRARQSSKLSAGLENGLLDYAGDQSGHATATQRRNV